MSVTTGVGMLKQLERTRQRRAKAQGPGASALAFLALVVVVVGGIGAIVSWLLWSGLGIGVGIIGGVAIVASGGLFVWSESRLGAGPKSPATPAPTVPDPTPTQPGPSDRPR